MSDTETAVAIGPRTLFSFLHAAHVMTDALDGALSETSLSAATLEALSELADAREPLAPRDLALRLTFAPRPFNEGGGSGPRSLGPVDKQTGARVALRIG